MSLCRPVSVCNTAVGALLSWCIPVQHFSLWCATQHVQQVDTFEGLAPSMHAHPVLKDAQPTVSSASLSASETSEASSGSLSRAAAGSSEPGSSGSGSGNTRGLLPTSCRKLLFTKNLQAGGEAAAPGVLCSSCGLLTAAVCWQSLPSFTHHPFCAAQATRHTALRAAGVGPSAGLCWCSDMPAGK